MTLSSLLNDYSALYGPSSLLLMNIAYFLPSIPLLLVSSFADEWLNQRFGAPRAHAPPSSEDTCEALAGGLARMLAAFCAWCKPGVRVTGAQHA